MTQNSSTHVKLLFSFSLSIFALLLFSSAIGLQPAAAQVGLLGSACKFNEIVYVDQDAVGTNNGGSWANAYNDLQDGLQEADSSAICGDTAEVWVATGIYTPGLADTDSFELLDDVAIYGGFVGTETARSERNWESNITVLSGDIDGNDTTNGVGVVVTTTNQAGTNSLHVVTSDFVSTSAVLDGFYITAGAAEAPPPPRRNANLAIPDDQGGGLYNDGGSPTLSNLIFQGNYADQEGGGLVSNNGAPILTNVSFYSNQAKHAGGMLLYDNGLASLTSVHFEENYANQDGGGLIIADSNPILNDLAFINNVAGENGGGLLLSNNNSTLINGTFSGNTAAEDGGGLYSENSTTNLYQVTFTGNSAGDEGGAILNAFGDITLIDATLSGNSSNFAGGGIFNETSDIQLTNVLINGNDSEFGGGLINITSNPTLTNVALSGNTADGGGAIYNAASNPTLINVTVNGNEANFDGGGIYNDAGSVSTIVNSIIWNNMVGGEIFTTTATIFNDASDALISHSILQNSGGSDSWDTDLGTDEGENLDIDPLFIGEISPTEAPTTTADLQLKIASPAINAGNTLSYTSVLTKELAGNLRIVDSVIDIGAYEIGCPADSLLYVDKGASGLDTGQSWTDAYQSLQSGLGHAKNCSVVTELWVASGVYTPGTTVTDTFSLVDGLAIFGGFTGTETLRAERDWVDNITVLSGDIGGDDTADSHGVVLTTTNQIGDNSYHVVSGSGISNTAVLDGFTITAGQADGALPHNWGGGIFLSSSSPTFSNLIIRGNSANQGGGLINSNLSSPQLTNVVVQNNSAENGGGINNVFSSSPILTNVTIRDNASSGSGGGMSNDLLSNPVLINVTIDGNSSGGNGGGIYNINTSYPVLSKVILSNNSAAFNGGGIYLNTGTLTVTKSLIENNISGESGGGLYGVNSNTAYVIDQTTISNNVAETVRGGGLYIRQGAIAQVTNSTISGNSAAANNGLADDAGNGGGIYVGGSVASYLTLEHVTITDNEAAGNGGGLDINRDDIGDVITVTSSIIAGNTDVGGYPDCHAYGTSSYNLVVDSTNLFGGSAGDDCQPGASDLSLTNLSQTINDVLLPLADNYGLEAGNTLSSTSIIQTHALVQDSPAIDASNSAYSQDQRNGIRPSGSSNDIGSFEAGLLLLDVSINGNGSGSVVLTGAEIDCAFGCSNLMVRDTVVTLTATAETGSTFTGWSAGCPTRGEQVCRQSTPSNCTDTGPCVVTMTSAQFIIATFEQNSYTLSVSTQGNGDGAVIKSPDMPTYPHGSVVTLTATADEDSTFAGWSSDCQPRSYECAPVFEEACNDTEVCVITMTNSVSIIALFEAESVNLNQPPDGGEVNTPKPEFDWDGVFEDPSIIVSYTVIVTSSEGITYTYTTTETTLVPSTGLPAGSYDWTVIGNRSDGGSVPSSQTFSFSIAPSNVYFPFVAFATAPACDTEIPLVADPIAVRPVVSVGEVFYTSTISIPILNNSCSVTLSSSDSEIDPILVDDILQISIGSNVLFEHDFSQTGSLVEESINLPQSVIEQISGQVVTITLLDYYGYLVSSTEVYLISE